MTPLIKLLTHKTGISVKNVVNILKLLEEGSTIPFIVRYRKEMSIANQLIQKIRVL